MKTRTLFFLFISMMFILYTNPITSQELSPANTTRQIYKGNNTNDYNDVTGLKSVREKTQTEINLLNEIRTLKASDNLFKRAELSHLEKKLALERGDNFTTAMPYPGTITAAPENTPFNPDAIGTTRIFQSSVSNIKAIATVTEERGATAGKLWACYAFSAGSSSPDTIKISYSTNNGVSWFLYGTGIMGGTDKINTEDMDMEIVENTTGEKYIWIFYGYRPTGGTGDWLTGGVVLQTPTFIGQFFALSWPGTDATKRYYNIRVTTDNSLFPNLAYLYFICSSDTINASSFHVNSQRYARITNPYAAVIPAVSYMPGNFWWQNSSAPANYIRTIYSDIAYVRNGAADSIIVSLNGVPDSTKIFFAKSDINGTAPVVGHFQAGNIADYKTYARLSSNGNANGSVICAFRQRNNDNWNIKYFRTLNYGTFTVLAGESILFGSPVNTNYQPDIVGRKNSNVYYMSFETSSSIDSVHYLSVTMNGIVDSYYKMNPINAASETIGPKAGYRFAAADSCFLIYSENGPSNVWAVGGCEGSVTNVTGSEISAEYVLAQNYPNPFNPNTNIMYSIPVNGFVKIVLYDVLGKETATLVNENKQAGSYIIGFDGSNLAAGAYFYKITVNDFTNVKKMILVK